MEVQTLYIACGLLIPLEICQGEGTIFYPNTPTITPPNEVISNVTKILQFF